MEYLFTKQVDLTDFELTIAASSIASKYSYCIYRPTTTSLAVYTNEELNGTDYDILASIVDNHVYTPPPVLTDADLIEYNQQLEALTGSYGTPSVDNPYVTTSDPRMSPATITQDGLLSQTDKGNLNSAYSHISSTDNPHSVSKTQVGLGNVDNTSDANKPISSATQTALNAKLESTDIANFETSTELNARDANNRDRANHTGTQAAATISDFGSSVEGNTQVALNTTHRGLTNNPHTVTKTQVGLGNVDNTSDADKPISSATQTALNGKINTSLIGAASGVASLGTDGKVPVGQLPTMTGTITSYYVQNTITSSTTSSTYQTYLTFTPDGSFPAGDYLVIANGQYSTSASLGTLNIALFSGSTELTDTTIRAGYFQAASANRLSYHMMTKLSLTSASAVSIRFLSNATNNTATLYTGKIYLQKL